MNTISESTGVHGQDSGTVSSYLREVLCPGAKRPVVYDISREVASNWSSASFPPVEFFPLTELFWLLRLRLPSWNRRTFAFILPRSITLSRKRALDSCSKCGKCIFWTPVSSLPHISHSSSRDSGGYIGGKFSILCPCHFRSAEPLTCIDFWRRCGTCNHNNNSTSTNTGHINSRDGPEQHSVGALWEIEMVARSSGHVMTFILFA